MWPLHRGHISGLLGCARVCIIQRVSVFRDNASLARIVDLKAVRSLHSVRDIRSDLD